MKKIKILQVLSFTCRGQMGILSQTKKIPPEWDLKMRIGKNYSTVTDFAKFLG